MALTDPEIRRIEDIETTLNTLQTAINNSASKRELKAALSILSTQLTQIQEDGVGPAPSTQRITDLETTVNEVQLALNNNASQRQLKALLAVLQPQINSLSEEITQLELTGSGGALQAHKDDAFAHDELDSRYYLKADDPLAIAAQVNVASGLDVEGKVLVGSAASSVDSPYTQVVISQGDTGYTAETGIIGLVSEAVANESLGAIGTVGVAKSFGSKNSVGITGLALSSGAEDLGWGLGVGGYALQPRNAMNVGLIGQAMNGTSNYALAMFGDIWSVAAQNWVLADDTASGLSFNSTDHRGLLVLDTTDDLEQVRIGDTADSADFPGARMIVSHSETGYVDPFDQNVGIYTEAPVIGSNYAAGLVAVSRSLGEYSGYGIYAEGTVSDTTDVGGAIGATFYSYQPHISGPNVALEVYAAGSETFNAAIFITGGDIYSEYTGLDWNLADDTASGLSFNSTDHRGLLVLDTTDDAEQVRIGETADSADFPYAQCILSKEDTGFFYTFSNLGLVTEAVADDVRSGVGLMSIGVLSDDCDGIGISGWGWAGENTTSNRFAIGLQGLAMGSHVGRNVALYAFASGASENYALQIDGGDFYNFSAMDWILADNVASGLSFNSPDHRGLLVLDTTDGLEQMRVGNTARSADFPYARAIFSHSGPGADPNEYARFGIVGEAKSDDTEFLYGCGVGGHGSVAGNNSAYGGWFIGGVSDTDSSGWAHGIGCYAVEDHAGGRNIGGYFFADNSSIANYSIFLARGDIGAYEHAGSKIFAIRYGQSESLTFNSRDFGTDIDVYPNLLVLDTTSGVEQVRVGNTADNADFPGAQLIVSQADTGGSSSGYAGIVGEAEADASAAALGGLFIARATTATQATGINSIAKVSAPSVTGAAIGISAQSLDSHSAGLNIAILANASNGSADYAFYNLGGDFLSVAAHDWILADNVASGLSFNSADHEGLLVLDTTTDAEQIRIGDTADSADFPNARMLVSKAHTGGIFDGNFSVASENSGGTAVFGVSSVDGSTQANGVFGMGRVPVTGDTGDAIGIRAHATNGHIGGRNIASYLWATNGDENYALWINGGDICTNAAADWLLADNTASGLSFNSTDHRGLLVLDTTDDAEQVRIGNTADSADFPNARMIVSRDDTGMDFAVSYVGLVAEAETDTGTRDARGVSGIAKVSGAGSQGYGVYGEAVGSTGTGWLIGVAGISSEVRATGENIGLLAYATGSSEGNYAFYNYAGDFFNFAAMDWDLADNEASGLSFDSTDKEGILSIDTTNDAEGIETTGYLKAPKVQLTPEGGIAVRLTNKTGASSVKGTVVEMSASVDNAVDVTSIDCDDPVGVIYEDGIADGAEVWVIVNGIAEVLIENSTAATRGYWVRTGSTTPGRADATTTSPPGADPSHWQEIGHCAESVGSGTNVLAKVVLHFN